MPDVDLNPDPASITELECQLCGGPNEPGPSTEDAHASLVHSRTRKDIQETVVNLVLCESCCEELRELLDGIEVHQHNNPGQFDIGDGWGFEYCGLCSEGLGEYHRWQAEVVFCDNDPQEHNTEQFVVAFCEQCSEVFCEFLRTVGGGDE